MKLDVKITSLAAAFLIAGIAGASAQAIDPQTDIPRTNSDSDTQLQTGEPAGVPPPGVVSGDPVPVAPAGNGFGAGFGVGGAGAGGGVVVQGPVSPVPVEPEEPALEPDVMIGDDID